MYEELPTNKKVNILQLVTILLHLLLTRISLSFRNYWINNHCEFNTIFNWIYIKKKKSEAW